MKHWTGSSSGTRFSGHRFAGVRETVCPSSVMVEPGSRSESSRMRTLWNWEQEAAVEMATRFQPGDAPLLRATVVLRSESAVLMLAAHHATADGVSIAHALEDLLRLVADEPLDAATLSPSLEDLISGGPGDEASRDDVTLRGLTVPDSVAAQGHHRPVPSVRSLRLSSDHTARLLDAERRNGITLHAALCAALVFSGRRKSIAWRRDTVRIPVADQSARTRRAGSASRPRDRCGRAACAA